MFYDYMKQKCFGGRNKLSRTADAILFRLLIFLSIYLLVPKTDFRLLITILLTIALCVILQIIAKLRLVRFTKKELKRIRRELQRDALLLMPHEHVSKMIGADSSFLRQTEPITISDILPCIALGCKKIFSVSPFKEETVSFVKRNNVEVELLGTDSLEENILVTDEQIKKYIKASQRTTNKAKLLVRFNPLNVSSGKYLLLGVSILFLSFFVRMPVYYRLLSNGCIIIASTFYIKRRISLHRDT